VIDAKYSTKVDDASVPRISSLIATAFGGPVKDCEEWVRNQGLGDIRGVERASGGGGRTDACLRRIEMGQFFGGRSVPMIGIAGVAVAPEARGQGLARWMMQHALEEMYERGEPLSALYASTQPLYRQVGYEQAGHRMTFTVPISELDVGERGGPWEVVELDSVERLHAPYRAYAAHFNGMLDRGAYVWKRKFELRGSNGIGYASIGADGAIDAYAVVMQKRKDSGRITIELSDLAFLDAAAGRKLLGMLHDYASMADELIFYGGPTHPLLPLLSQQHATGAFKEFWMLRLVRVADALRLRGYNPAVNTEVHLHVTDETLPGNSGPLVLRVAGGRAEVTPGGRGEVRVSERALASLYSGFLTPASARLGGGAIDGPELAMSALGAAFCGTGTPWMTDFF
jgi:predicted acetyltransferase